MVRKLQQMEVGEAYTDWFGPGRPALVETSSEGSRVYAPFAWDMGLARTARRPRTPGAPGHGVLQEAMNYQIEPRGCSGRPDP